VQYTVKQIASRKSHVLHYLMPAKRDVKVTSRLRSMNKYPTVRARTNRYKNFHSLWISKLSVSLAVVMCLFICLCLCVFELFFRFVFSSIHMPNKPVVVVVVFCINFTQSHELDI